MQRTEIKAQYCAYDCRGHGETQTQDEELSIDQLIADCLSIVSHLTSFCAGIVLVGHSMGGAVAAKTAQGLGLGSGINLRGVIVLDVVEGTALAALTHMQNILASRPASFPTQEDAVRWSLASGSLRLPLAARYSVPSQLVIEKKTEDEPKEPEFVWRANLLKTMPYWTSM
jgi:protein phosphatase methylesterase 1